jgi:hypothetical protein
VADGSAATKLGFTAHPAAGPAQGRLEGGQGAYEDQLVKQGGQWRIAHRWVRTDRLVADPQKPVNLADPDGAALVRHLLEAAQRLGQKVE